MLPLITINDCFCLLLGISLVANYDQTFHQQSRTCIGVFNNNNNNNNNNINNNNNNNTFNSKSVKSKNL